MSKEFRDNAGTKLAWWTKDGTQVLAPYGIDEWIIPAFIAWLHEGPPTRKWRVTRTFDYRPTYVAIAAQGPEGPRDLIDLGLTGVEEVWE